MRKWLDVGQLEELPRLEFGAGSPRVAVTAGMHGDEQTGIYAADRLINFLTDQTTLQGSVVVMPLCNPSAFLSRTRTSPYDRRDLNRSFRGPGQQGYTALLADRIWEAVWQADYVIDLHCCGDHASLYVLALYNENAVLREMAAGLGIPTVVQAKKTRGQLAVETSLQGRGGLIIEIPGGQPSGVVDTKAGDQAFEALCRFLGACGILPGRENGRGSDILFHRGIQRCFSNHQGLFRLHAQPGSLLKKGDCVGTVDDISYAMPFSGTVLSVSPDRYLFTGEHVFSAAELLR